jgi:hypothetical protein
MADDFLCSDKRPITDIHWWGSYIDWQGTEPPPTNVIGFHIGIWTDVPKNTDQPWSHPGQMICGWSVARNKVNETRVGCDFFPGKPSDTCFRYDFLIPTGEWCIQPEQQAVLWVSISAIYGQPTAQSFFWGWKTREHFYNDVAVKIFIPQAPTIGSVFQQGQPLDDTLGLGNWDMAFEVTTNVELPTVTPTKVPNTNTPTPKPTSTATATKAPTPTITPEFILKWSQPPVLNTASPHPNCFWGWDEFSIYNPGQFEGVVLPDTPHFMADDFLCNDNRPISDIHWWGSYIDWDGTTPPPTGVIGFHIGLWTDVPKTAAQPWSHPRQMIWEWTVPRSQLNEKYVGCDFYPNKPQDSCFHYDFQIPPTEWFFQPEVSTIYWISIAAVYGAPVQPAFYWGWKTRPLYFNDAAVKVFVPIGPTIGSVFQQGQPLIDPVGEWDMAFELTTNQVAPSPTPTHTPVGGKIDSDGDGVSDAVEDQGPNGGDGNKDGIPDKNQPGVTSVPNAGDGRPLVLVVEPGHTLSDVHPVGTSTVPPPPVGRNFPLGLLSFEIDGVAPGEEVKVEILLPDGVTVDSYYKYGRTFDNPTPHWYPFMFDGSTGAEILPGKIILHFKDGQRGDDDLLINGVITEPGGPSGAIVFIEGWQEY